VCAAAALLVELGRVEDAEARLEALLRVRPYDAEAALGLAGLRLEREGEVEAARELARRAAAFGGGAEAAALLERLEAEEKTRNPSAAEAG
jgi:hypothetical protein